MSEKAIFKNMFYDFCVEWGRFFITVFIKVILGGILFIVVFFTSLGLLLFGRYIFSNHPGLILGLFLGMIIVLIQSWLKECKRAKTLNKLEKVKNELIKLINPDKMYERFDIDPLQIRMNEKLLDMVNEESFLMRKIISLRIKLTDKYGYVIPGVRALDDIELRPYEYKFFIREMASENGFVYPDRLMVKKSDLDSSQISIPEDAIAAISPLDKSEVVWIGKEQLPNDINIDFMEPFDVIIEHLEVVCINNTDKIISLAYVQKLLDHIENKVYENTLFPSLISIVDLQKILIKLVKQRISIKDIEFILDKLADYARLTKDVDELTKKIILNSR